MRIGISVRGRRSSQAFWRDGASQHAVFLAVALMRLPFVRAVVLIDVGSECRLPREVDEAAPGLSIVTQQQACGEVDVVIELVRGFGREWLDVMRSRGCKVIFCCSGAACREEAPRRAGVTRTRRCDEVWLQPKDELTVPLMHMLYRCPVRVVPFVWSPMFVERRVAGLERGGIRYGYDAQRPARDARASGWRVAIVEPDLTAMKEPGIPMLACEDAYRAKQDAVSELHVLNAARLKADAKRAVLAAVFELVRDRRTTFHGPHDLVAFVGQHADAVFAHQQNDGDAYGYLDVLYGGYPLIHNSPSLLDAGYYYPGADVAQGARAFLAALHAHDATLDAYRTRSRALFDAVDPFSDANRSAYAHALLSLGTVHDAG